MSETESNGETLLPHQSLTSEYLTRLTPNDRENVSDIALRFTKTLQKLGLKGDLLAVGGSINKPLPRKDIDLLILVKRRKTDVIAETGIEKAMRDFNGSFKPIVEAIAPKEEGFETIEIIEPAIDEEYQNPNLLKHDGAISVRRNGSTPLDFIRSSSSQELAEFAKGSKRLWVLLSEVELNKL